MTASKHERHLSFVPARLVLRQPDDWHVHLRDGDMLGPVLDFTARQFARAIVMPNLNPPIATLAAAKAYKARITAALRPEHDFTPLMTLYLTDSSDPHQIEHGFTSGLLRGCKLYPANATTNSALGVTDISNIHRVLELMQRIGMPLLIHGEVTDYDIDIFDREVVFIERHLARLVTDFPALKIVFEHITTSEAVAFVSESGPNLAATITPHHLAINRNAMFVEGIRPHFYCLPVAKREPHRLALRRAATCGSPKFFLGTDSAPHSRTDKEAACGCAGIFNAPFALESYTAAFEEENALDRLEDFASINGAKFYGLQPNKQKVILERKPIQVPSILTVGSQHVVPFLAGEILPWRIVGQTEKRTIGSRNVAVS